MIGKNSFKNLANEELDLNLKVKAQSVIIVQIALNFETCILSDFS